MLQTRFFEQPLARTLRRPSQDKDPRVFQASELAERGEYLEAAELALALIEDGSHDIRVICHYLCGVFMESGARSLASIAPRLLGLLTDELDTLTPEHKRERVIDAALSWLFRVISQQCTFQAAQKDDIWQAWMAAMDSACVAELAHALVSLQGVMAELVESPQSQAQLSRLQRWLKDSVMPVVARRERDQARREAEAEARAQAEARARTDENAGETGMAPGVSGQAESSSPGLAQAGNARSGTHPAEPTRAVAGGIEPSPALVRLMRKLQAFEQLMKQGSTAKAAVIAADIRDTIANFDPLVYLPKLFSNYVQLLSTSIEELMPYWHESESPTWQALEQFYRTDLDRFIGE